MISQSTFVRSSALLYELDLVAIRIFNEGDHGGAVLHRPGFARDLAAALAHQIAGLCGIVHFECDVAVAIAEIVTAGVPVVLPPDDGAVALVLIAAENGKASVR